MSLTSLETRRVHQLLADGEALVASLAGYEVDGRRRRFVAITDRRALAGWFRSPAPEEFPLDGLEASFDPATSVLTLRHGDDTAALRDVPAVSAHAIVDLLSHRQPPPPESDAGARPPRIRIFTP
ncbi:MAG: hypothetical protein WD010_01465 [Nitriliruptor sp.]|uniref:hypothetical protein n=1 Tax=Nitriliruptor sp. TaxID=2448056 RepID=UPI00349FFC6E